VEQKWSRLVYSGDKLSAGSPFRAQKYRGQAREDKPSGRSQAGEAGQARPYFERDFERDPMLDQLVAAEQNKKQKEHITHNKSEEEKRKDADQDIFWVMVLVAEEAS
jgi:hypothetical protein